MFFAWLTELIDLAGDDFDLITCYTYYTWDMCFTKHNVALDKRYG